MTRIHNEDEADALEVATHYLLRRLREYPYNTRFQDMVVAEAEQLGVDPDVVALYRADPFTHQIRTFIQIGILIREGVSDD